MIITSSSDIIDFKLVENRTSSPEKANLKALISVSIIMALLKVLLLCLLNNYIPRLINRLPTIATGKAG